MSKCGGGVVWGGRGGFNLFKLGSCDARGSIKIKKEMKVIFELFDAQIIMRSLKKLYKGN